MTRRSRHGLDPWTAALVVVAVLVLAAVAALQLSGGGGGRGSTSALTPADVQRIAPPAARDLLLAGSATLLDVRPPAEYERAHAEGAWLFPESEEERLVDALPAEGALIFY